MNGVYALAESATTTAMSTAFEALKGDALTALATVAPFAIAVMGAFLVWRYGIRFFKSMSK